ncbi:MAG: Uma2 family endonuclease [Planctomycetota bacterium]|nr:Uma2 family endonuclease [Planctomycetota bacterium]
MTALLSEAPDRQAESSPPLGERAVLPGVDWDAYLKISDALTGRHLRLCYSNGTLEFMTISPKHGNCCRLLGQFVVALTEETERPRRSFGDMTLNRADLEKGIEPDESFYIDHEPDIRGKDDINLAIDPPPDLGIEVDLASSSRIRMGAYSALRVPEIWRFANDTVAILLVDENAAYSVNTHSRLFPFLSAEVINRFLALRMQMDETRLLKSFREWVRGEIGESKAN